MINRRRSGVRGTPAKVNANAGLAASDKVNSASVSDGSHESVYLCPFYVLTPVRDERLPTRTIVVTTFARPGYLTRARAVGVRGYLLKDTPADQLAAAIRTVATGGQVIRADLAAATWEAGDDPLTDRERDALRLAEQGLSNKEIARRLVLSPGTVRNYLSDAAAKLGAANRIEAGRVARNNGWL